MDNLKKYRHLIIGAVLAVLFSAGAVFAAMHVTEEGPELFAEEMPDYEPIPEWESASSEDVDAAAGDENTQEENSEEQEEGGFWVLPMDETTMYVAEEAELYEGPHEELYAGIGILEYGVPVTVNGHISSVMGEAADWYRVKDGDGVFYMQGAVLAKEDPFAGMSILESGTVQLKSCVINGGNVEVSLHISRAPESDDGKICLFSQEIYESEASARQIASADIGKDMTFTVPLGFNTADCVLFRKFFAGIIKDGAVERVSSASYITNPGAAAAHTVSRMDHGKKGILPAAVLLHSGGLSALGVKQCTYNVPLGNLCSGGGISYNYNGKTYYFNAGIVGQYDQLIPLLTNQGIQITLILLNNGGGGNLIHPSARNGSSNYYAFNTAEQAGAEKLAAAAAFMAERYSGTGRGQVDNWIVGNEVNARTAWHYMASTDLETFTEEYVKALRLFYNSIKSQNANANVYICLDQQWGESSDTSRYYAGRSLLDTLNAQVRREGNIDWGLAIHPYNYPLTSAAVWKESSKVRHSDDTPYVTMQNVDVVTDHMCREELLDTSGNVRSILCSEVGYTSSEGQGIQAASIVYAYMQAEMNQHIDGFILARELDDSGEIAQGLANGIVGLGGGRKTAYDFYRGIDTEGRQVYLDQASAVIGVPDLTALLQAR